MRKRHRYKLPPTNIRKLVAHSGLDKAAKALGTTTPSLKKIMQFNTAEQSKELAAQFLYEQANKQKDHAAVISGDDVLIDMVKMLADKMDGKFTMLN